MQKLSVVLHTSCARRVRVLKIVAFCDVGLKNNSSSNLSVCVGFLSSGLTSGCRNVSHHYRQQSISGLHSPGRSNYTITCYPRVQTIYCTEFLLTISIQYQADKSDENKVKYQLEDYDYKLIQYQILQTNITRVVWQTVTRITNEILGVKGLRCCTTVKVLYQSDR